MVEDVDIISVFKAKEEGKNTRWRTMYTFRLSIIRTLASKKRKSMDGKPRGNFRATGFRAVLCTRRCHPGRYNSNKVMDVGVYHLKLQTSYPFSKLPRPCTLKSRKSGALGLLVERTTASVPCL